MWIRGDAVSSGYYVMEEKTKESFDSDGWFHTGDIAIWDQYGQLKIVDRPVVALPCSTNGPNRINVCLPIVTHGYHCATCPLEHTYPHYHWHHPRHFSSASSMAS